jgi:hypothetical protein
MDVIYDQNSDTIVIRLANVGSIAGVPSKVKPDGSGGKNLILSSTGGFVNVATPKGMVRVNAMVMAPIDGSWKGGKA